MCTSPFSAQTPLIRFDGYKIVVNGKALENPWAGGINSAQLSLIDLDLDGQQDIFLFDRDANRILTFLRKDQSDGSVKYEHSAQYQQNWPDLKNWVLLRDFNCDGKADIFTNNANGIAVYSNTSNPSDGLSFSLFTSRIKANYHFEQSQPFESVVYCLSTDLPSIVDHDGDGDLDIFSFTESASTVYYYQNQSQELGYCDSLIFDTANRCYGMFAESAEDNTIVKGEDFTCAFNMENPRSGGAHSGGTLLSIDLNQDQIHDLIISDVSYNNLTALLMEKSGVLDSVATCDLSFPANFGGSQAVDLLLFPGAFYEDLDGDDVKDLLSSPNARFGASNVQSMWYYRNEGSDERPDFKFEQKDFLQNQMIDHGSNAYPALVDYNADGRMDLMISNKDYHKNDGSLVAQLALYKNTGSIEEPSFELVDANYLNISQYDIKRSYPTFGDMDQDGDDDLILGEETGTLLYFENRAEAGAEAKWELSIKGIMDHKGQVIDVGSASTPQIFDLDKDGLPDLLVGEKNGNVNYFKNVGTPKNFLFEHLIDTIGGVVASNYLGVNGYSVPHMFYNNAGEMELFIGSEVGWINHYNDIENNLDSVFNLLSLQFNGIREGDFAAPFVYDINADGKYDLFYGQSGGGLSFYAGDSVFLSIPSQRISVGTIGLFPNPAEHFIQFSLPETKASNFSLSLYNTSGVLCGELQLNNILPGQKIEYSIQHLPSGLYFLVLSNQKGRSYTEKFIKK